MKSELVHLSLSSNVTTLGSKSARFLLSIMFVLVMYCFFLEEWGKRLKELAQKKYCATASIQPVLPGYT